MKVVRNDAMSIDEIRELAPDRICISPGPARRTRPASAVMSSVSLARTPSTHSHLRRLPRPPVHWSGFWRRSRPRRPPHARQDLPIFHTGKSVFAGLPSPITATRYHSLIVKRDTLPDCLEITAETENGTIMGLMHKELPSTVSSSTPSPSSPKTA